VTNELAGQFGLLDWCVLWDQWSRKFECHTTLNRVGEFALGTSALLVGRVLVCEHASGATFVGASDLERTLVSATRRIGNDRTGG